MADAPNLFRVMLEVSNLNAAVTFYSKLLGIEGSVLRGSRAYFDCGSVILDIVTRPEVSGRSTSKIPGATGSASWTKRPYTPVAD